MNLDVGLMILGVAVLLLVIFCIPVLVNLWRAVQNVAVTLETLNANLPAILKNLEEISTNINNSTSAVNREIQNISSTVDRFHLVMADVADSVQNVAPKIAQSPALRTVKNAIAAAKGVSVFLNVLSGKEKKRF
ncbi:MAG: DUF948 domain-containing protein [Smithellaceae bacterium]|jgi:uncharacterized protein YoxC